MCFMSCTSVAWRSSSDSTHSSRWPPFWHGSRVLIPNPCGQPSVLGVGPGVPAARWRNPAFWRQGSCSMMSATSRFTHYFWRSGWHASRTFLQPSIPEAWLVHRARRWGCEGELLIVMPARSSCRPSRRCCHQRRSANFRHLPPTSANFSQLF